MNIDRRLLLAGMATAPFAAHAKLASRRDVQWAGVSLKGSWQESQALMPVVTSLLNTPFFMDKVRDRVERAVIDTSHPEISFVVERKLMQGDDAYALAFVLAGESVTHQKIDNVTEVSFELQSLVLIGNVSKDPQRQRVVACYPLRVRHRAVYPEDRLPTAEDARKVFASMLTGDRQDGTADLVAEWQSRLSRVHISEREVWVAIAPMKFTSEAQSEGRISDSDVSSISSRAGSLIEANLSRAANIPLVPMSREGAIDTLTLSFANLDVVAFRNPDPTHIFEFTVTALRSAVMEQALVREKQIALAFGAGIRVDYARVDSERNKQPELSMRLKHVLSRTFIGSSAASRQIDSRSAFGAVLMNFSDQVAGNLVRADRRWLESAKADAEPRSADDLVRLLAKLPFRAS